MMGSLEKFGFGVVGDAGGRGACGRRAAGGRGGVFVGGLDDALSHFEAGSLAMTVDNSAFKRSRRTLPALCSWIRESSEAKMTMSPGDRLSVTHHIPLRVAAPAAYRQH